MELTEEILKRIDLVAAKLGVAATEIFKIYTQKAVVQGSVDVGLGIILLGGAVTCVYQGIKLIKAGIKTYEEDWKIPTGTLLAIVGGVVFGVAGMLSFKGGLLTLLAPQAAALEMIRGLF